LPDITVLDIPYERQTDPASNRMCGAAALCMVYRSFGMSCSQAEVATRLTRPGPSANMGVRTYLLAQDALARGYGAIVMRARDPLATLKGCHNRLLRVILNHRPRPESPNGHFTVLVDFDGEHVVVHDPLAGPNTRILQSDLLKLWQPLGGTSEITGNVLVVLAKEQQSAAPCRQCGSRSPETIACPGCHQSVALRPASVLGCMSGSCPERAWETLFCPFCDSALIDARGKDFSSPQGAKSSETGSAAAARPEEIDDDPLKILEANEAINKFLALALSVNNGRPVPGAEGYLATIRECQAELLSLQKKQAAELRAKAAQPPPAPPPPKPAPPPKPVTAQSPPRPPVDWNELARKLVEEMGYRPR